jgi:MFS family permease
VLADRLPARTIMVAAHLVRGAVVGAMAAIALSGTASIPLLAALGVLFGAADAAFVTAQQAFLPRTLEPDRLPSGNALLQGTIQLASIIAPPMAGAAIVAVGTGAAFVVDAASFFVAAGILLLISARGVSGSAAAGRPDANVEPDRDVGSLPGAEAGAGDTVNPSFVDQLREGIAYVLADPALRLTLLISLVMNFALGGPSAVGVPWLAEIAFEAGPVGLGLLTAAFAIGALVGTVLAGNATLERQGRRLLLAIGTAGVGLLVIAFAPSIWLVCAVLAAMGLTIGYTNIVALSWLQRRVEPAMVGRVLSIVMLMGFGITPLSFAVAGWLLDVNAAAMFAGAGAIVVATTAFATLRGFERLFDAPDPRSSDARELDAADAGQAA